jgi:hypothetical protein
MIYTKQRPHNLSVLLDELLAAIPAMRPVDGADGVKHAAATVSGDGTNLWIQAPDSVSPATIDAVVMAHTNPAPVVPAPVDYGTDPADMTDRPAIIAAVQTLRGYLGLASPTGAQTVGALKLLIRLTLALLKRLI